MSWNKWTVGGVLAVGLAVRPQPSHTEPNYVRLDVFATANGAPVGDLTQDELEILDNNVSQTIEAFERVDTAASAGGRRARVFVIFLDTAAVAGGADVRRALAAMLDRASEDGDLVAVMTPELTPADISFSPKRGGIERVLSRYTAWSERRESSADEESAERDYRACFPTIASELLARRREKASIDALERLALFLRGAREERKTVLAITRGWPLVGPDPKLQRAQLGRIDAAARLDCDRDRVRLSMIDDRAVFRRMLDEANRADASMYPVNPDAFERRHGSGSGAAGIDALRTLASATDAAAMLDAGDIEPTLARLRSDGSAYYLVGYRSSEPVDGKFHAITVRAKRPGIQVRTRRGYLATDVTLPGSAEASPYTGAPNIGGAHLVTATGDAPLASAAAEAVATLASLGREQPFKVLVSAGWRSGPGGVAPAFWVVGEVADRIPGADLDVQVTTAAGRPVAMGTGRVEPGSTSALVSMTPAEAIAPGEYDVRVGFRLPAASSAAQVRVSLLPAPRPSGAVFIRRGPLTGNREVPSADLRFRRSERVRVEIPIVGDGASSARLLDRTGKPVPVPVEAGTRVDADGARWATAALAVVPLAPGDYIIELTRGTDDHTLVAFRVVP